MSEYNEVKKVIQEHMYYGYTHRSWSIGEDRLPRMVLAICAIFKDKYEEGSHT